MTLTGIALSNLTHRPWRTGLTLLGVALAIAAYVALVGLTRGIENTLLEGFASRGTDVVMTEAGAADILSSVVPEGLAAEVAEVEGVRAAAPETGQPQAAPGQPGGQVYHSGTVLDPLPQGAPDMVRIASVQGGIQRGWINTVSDMIEHEPDDAIKVVKSWLAEGA